MKKSKLWSIILIALPCIIIIGMTVAIAYPYEEQGCKSNWGKPYEFAHSTENISRVGICWFYHESNSPQYSIVSEVEDIDSFLNDFAQIKFRINIIPSPSDLCNEYGVLIEYKNGDYEVIGLHAQELMINGKQEFGIVHCDKEELNLFMAKYADIK